MKLLGLDFETTSAEPEKCEVTEIGIVGYDTDMGTSPVMSYTSLNSDVEIIEPMAEKITGISVERCKTYGVPFESMKTRTFERINTFQPDFIVAHNGTTFDRVIFERLFLKDALFQYPLDWIDTMTDLPLSVYEELRTGQLELMAARIGFVNPFPHAALPDVMTMMKILLMQPDLNIIVERSKSPMIDIKANVSFDEKDLAKEQKFGWQQYRGGKHYPKTWVKSVKECDLEELSKNWTFNWSKL